MYSLYLAKPKIPIFREVYRFYFDKILPVIGRIVQGNFKPYSYLAESLKRFPDQDKLKNMYLEAGLMQVNYQEIAGGIAAIHQGTKRRK